MVFLFALAAVGIVVASLIAIVSIAIAIFKFE